MNSASSQSNIVAQIGDTPLVELTKVTDGLSPDVEVWAKLEFFNPGGSIKDRPARQIILDAIEDGKLGNGQTLIDSTSGNTGIAYAMVGAAMDIPVSLVMPENASSARKFLIQRYGADCIYSDPMQGSDGALEKAKEIVADDENDEYFYANQYGNPSNPKAHYLTTAPEIWSQTDGEITHFVTGMGTSGTVMGTATRLRELNENIEITGVQPSSSFHGLEGMKHIESAITPEIYDDILHDSIEKVDTESGWEMANRLATEEGIGAGYSAGANVVGALQVAEKLNEGVVVTIICDHVERYVEE
jgi:cysteine synthase B